MRLSAISAFVAVGLFSSVAYAHPLVDEGKSLMERARFERALSVFERAERQSDLLHADLVEMTEARCLIFHALNRSSELNAQFQVLSSISPAHRFGREAPPELQDAFDAVADAGPGPIQVSIEAVRTESQVTFNTDVDNDVASLVRSVRVMARIDQPLFTDVTGSTLSVAEPVEFYAEALGPGGAVLAESGSEDEPHRVGGSEPDRRARDVQERPTATPVGLDPEVDEDEGGSLAWLWITLGVLAAGGLAVGAVLLFGSNDGGTEPQYPVVMDF